MTPATEHVAVVVPPENYHHVSSQPYSTPYLPPSGRGRGVPLPPFVGGVDRVYSRGTEVTSRV